MYMVTGNYQNCKRAHALIVKMKNWSGRERAFMLQCFFLTSDSYTVAMRRFCNHYNIPNNDTKYNYIPGR